MRLPVVLSMPVAAILALGALPPAAPESPDSPEALYGRLEADCGEFERGLEGIRLGDRARGERTTAAAMDRIVAGLRACAATGGCDIEIYFDAIARLLEIERRAAGPEEAANPAPAGPGAGEFPPDAPSPGATETGTMFRGRDLRELIELNEPVRAALNEWLTWLRPHLMDSYENYLYLRDAIAPVYEEAGFPEALLFGVVATETGGKVHAVSSAGATGLMQFMSGTGQRYGLTVEDGFDLRLDPVRATRANVAYLNEQLATLNQNLEKALAAYNGGENRLRRLHQRLGDIDFWDGRFYNSLPNETRQYVPRILAAAWLFLHAGDYNLQFPSFPANTTVLALRRDTSIDQLTICLGQAENRRNGWFRTLRNLNPQLEYNDTLKAGDTLVVPAILREAYEKNCLEGALVDRAFELHDARQAELILYTVVRGDTLIQIARRFNRPAEEIAAINNLRGPEYILQIGQKLKVPSSR